MRQLSIKSLHTKRPEISWTKCSNPTPSPHPKKNTRKEIVLPIIRPALEALQQQTVLVQVGIPNTIDKEFDTITIALIETIQATHDPLKSAQNFHHCLGQL
jgi:hypothetical protein